MANVAVRSNIFGRESQVADAIGGTIRRFGEGVEDTFREVDKIERKGLEIKKAKLSIREVEDRFNKALQSEQDFEEVKSGLIGEFKQQFGDQSAEWVDSHVAMLDSVKFSNGGMSELNRRFSDLNRMQATFKNKPKGSLLRKYSPNEVLDLKGAERYDASGVNDKKTFEIGQDVSRARALLEKNEIKPDQSLEEALTSLPADLATKQHVIDNLGKTFLSKEKLNLMRTRNINAEANRTRAVKSGAKETESLATTPRDELRELRKEKSQFLKNFIENAGDTKKERTLNILNAADNLLVTGKVKTMAEAKSLATESVDAKFNEEAFAAAEASPGQEDITGEAALSQKEIENLPQTPAQVSPESIGIESELPQSVKDQLTKGQPKFDLSTTIVSIVSRMSKLSPTEKRTFELATDPANTGPKAERVLARLERVSRLR